MKAGPLIGFCAVWLAIGGALIVAFPGSSVASGLGCAILGFTLGATLAVCFFGPRGFAHGFIVGGIVGFIWGVTHVYTAPSGGFVAALGGALAGAILGTIWGALAFLTGKLLGGD